MSALLDDRLDVLLKEVAEARRETMEARRETVEARRDLASVRRELAAVRAAIEGADVRTDSAPTVKDQLLTRKEAARQAGVHPATMGRWIVKHPFLCVLDGNGRRRVSKTMLIDFMHGRV